MQYLLQDNRDFTDRVLVYIQYVSVRLQLFTTVNISSAQKRMQIGSVRQRYCMYDTGYQHFFCFKKRKWVEKGVTSVKSAVAKCLQKQEGETNA